PTPARPGRVTVGPPTMSMARATERAGGRHGFFFGGLTREPIELSSEPVALDVLPLPDQGKPAGLSGAVGRFALDVRAAPLDVTAGDPVTLTYTVSGAGDLSSVTPPALVGSDALRVYPVPPAAAPPPAPRGQRRLARLPRPPRRSSARCSRRRAPFRTGRHPAAAGHAATAAGAVQLVRSRGAHVPLGGAAAGHGE